MLKFAVVGMGLMGMLHARILNSIRGVQVAYAVDISDARLADASSQLGVATTKSLAHVIDEVDAVSITLPDDLHVEACTLALAQGKYVLVEKPLATSAADAQKILDAQVAPHRLMVAHLLRFDLRLRELKRRIDAGQLGNIEFFRIHRANPRAAVRRLGGRSSVTAFLGVHDIDVMLWLTGAKVTRVSASGRKFISGHWDVSAAHLDLDNGALATLENHWLIHDSLARSCIAGVQIFGDKGTAALDLSTDELELATDELAATRRIDSRNWTHDGGVGGGSLRREIEAFVGAVQNGFPMPVSGEDALEAVAVLNKVEEALEARS